MSVSPSAIWHELTFRALQRTGVEPCAFHGFEVETCAPNFCVD